jgi:hypothetical protein
MIFTLLKVRKEIAIILLMIYKQNTRMGSIRVKEFGDDYAKGRVK